MSEFRSNALSTSDTVVTQDRWLGTATMRSAGRERPETKIESAAETAYRRLRELVVTGVLPPGVVLNEQDLVDRLGIGRTPVREAVQRLASQHVLTIFPRRGIAVSKLGLADIQAIFEARESIEAKLAALAALRRTDDEAFQLGRIGDDVRDAGESQDYKWFLARDQDLHHSIARAARSRFLAETAAYLLMLSDWVWHQYFMLKGSSPSDYFRHDTIIQAIVERDSERAYLEMKDHIQHSRDLVRRIM